jgi:hypothetical protein
LREYLRFDRENCASLPFFIVAQLFHNHFLHDPVKLEANMNKMLELSLSHKPIPGIPSHARVRGVFSREVQGQINHVTRTESARDDINGPKAPGG